MENEINTIEKNLEILNKKLDSFESELDNLEMKVSIIKEIKKDNTAQSSKEIEKELKKIIDRIQSLMVASGMYNIK